MFMVAMPSLYDPMPMLYKGCPNRRRISPAHGTIGHRAAIDALATIMFATLQPLAHPE
jgi:hypothetical protein